MNPLHAIKHFFANTHPALRTEGEVSINPERVTQSVRMRFNPLRGLTPERLSQYLEEFDAGFLRQAAITWDKIERRDFTLRAVAPKRKKAAARHGWEIATVSNVSESQQALAQKQVQALTYFYNTLTATDAIRPDQTGGLSLLVRQMMDAQGKYFAVHEIVWQPKLDGLSAQFVFCPLWWFEATTGKLRYLDSEAQLYGRDLASGQWLVTVGEGLMEASSVAWMFKHLSLQDWVACCEKFGTPFLDAATTASPGSAEWDALVDYVQNFGPDGGGVRSQSATITPIQISASAGEMFSKMVENMDRALTILWRGGDLSTSSGKDRAGASLQQEESDILESDDAALIEETLATQVSRNVITWTCGAEAPVLAYLKFRHAPQQNLSQDLQIDSFLLNAGAPLEIKNALERYGRPIPEPGAKLLALPAGQDGGALPRRRYAETPSRQDAGNPKTLAS